MPTKAEALTRRSLSIPARPVNPRHADRSLNVMPFTLSLPLVYQCDKGHMARLQPSLHMQLNEHLQDARRTGTHARSHASARSLPAVIVYSCFVGFCSLP
jgi:hypothetical protein